MPEINPTRALENSIAGKVMWHYLQRFPITDGGRVVEVREVAGGAALYAGDQFLIGAPDVGALAEAMLQGYKAPLSNYGDEGEMAGEDLYCTVAEAAQILLTQRGITIHTDSIRDALRAGRLRGTKIGNSLFVDKLSLQEWEPRSYRGRSGSKPVGRTPKIK